MTINLYKKVKNQQGVSALLLVIMITTLTLVSAVVISGINATNTKSNFQLTKKESLQVDLDSCVNDALWRLDALKQTEGSFNMDKVSVACSYKIGAASAGLKSVTTTASSTTGFGSWGKTVVLSVNVSSTPVRVDSYKDATYYDTISATAALCGDWRCTAGETCSNCPIDCGQCYCGNGSCSGTENCNNCATDCGSCPVCGNGIKETGEVCDYTGSYNCSANDVYDGAVGCAGGELYCDALCGYCTNVCAE
ncbi:MAG: hypothetical protein C3F02_00190 [Parcubacteria group bacterium]|nr:MAG: hypothetical protein C3F02_00190 [Parcubacteria group bacterium]